MGSWYQCGGCGDVLPGDDPDATCSCITVPVHYYALTESVPACRSGSSTEERQMAVFALMIERDETINALEAPPLVIQRFVGVRGQDGETETTTG